MKKSLAIAFAVSGATPSVAADWSGPFVGVTGGYGAGEQSQRGGVLILPRRGGMNLGGGGGGGSTPPSSGPISSNIQTAADGRYGLSGGLVGGAVGYNWQTNHIVYGVEVDGAWSGVGGSGGCGFGTPVAHGCGGSIRALGTLRGNIGYDLPTGFGTFAGARIFAAGGLAVGNVKAWDAFLGNSGSKTVAGWTVGGGVEALLGQHWSVRLEYLHVDLGQHTVFTAIPPNPERVRTTAELVRVGLSYHFNATAAPVIAKY